MTLLAPSLQAFFTDRLMRQLQASGHTIRSYRATWRLLLLFAAAQTEQGALRTRLRRSQRPADHRFPRPP